MCNRCVKFWVVLLRTESYTVCSSHITMPMCQTENEKSCCKKLLITMPLINGSQFLVYAFWHAYTHIGMLVVSICAVSLFSLRPILICGFQHFYQVKSGSEIMCIFGQILKCIWKTKKISPTYTYNNNNINDNNTKRTNCYGIKAMFKIWFVSFGSGSGLWYILISK